MILIDSSAWVHFFRRNAPYHAVIDDLLQKNDAAICGPVVTELRRGMRPKERRETLETLEGCIQLEQPDKLWERAGDLGLLLRTRGVTAKTMDLLIATYALEHKAWLLADDSDFLSMQRAHVPLTLVSP